MIENEIAKADLTVNDINVLIEALDSWEQKDFSGEIMGDLLGMMLTDKKDSKQKEEYERDKQQRRAEYELGKRERKDRSILLKAKLIGIRDIKLNNKR